VYRYDYILRLIERLGRVLRELRDRLMQRQLTNDDLRAQIHEIAREAGLDLALARRLDVQTLVTWIAPVPGQGDGDRIWLMAELLYVEGMAARAAGDARQADGDLRRALALFERLSPTWRPGTDLATAAERAAEVRAALTSLEPGE